MEPIHTDPQTARDTIKNILGMIGEDPGREGLAGTPDRVVRSWAELFGGYKADPASIMTVFEEGACDEMVILRDIEFYSTCEHHMLPFFGRAHVGYLPNGKVIGVSKIARLVDIYAKRLQVQERLTAQVADCLMQHLSPKGVIVVMTGVHMCMVARGVGKQNSRMTTSAIRGSFQDTRTKAEFLSLCRDS